MRRHIFAALSIALCWSAASVSYADPLRCAPPNWKMLDVQGGRLFAHVERQCTLTLPQAADLQAFRERYVAGRKTKAQRVHSENSVPGGVRLDLTDVVRTDDGQLVIRSTTDVLQPSPQKFSAHMRSTNLDATGNARYTLTVENRVNVQEVQPGTYTITVGNQTVIRKPKLAPSSMLKSKVRAGLERDILRFSDTTNRQFTGSP